MRKIDVRISFKILTSTRFSFKELLTSRPL